MRSAVRVLPLVVLLCASCLLAAPKKDTPPGRGVVDSGSFGIFISGRRIATEKFEITKQGGDNFTRAELKVDDGSNKAEQKSELQLTATGELVHYSWNELSPGKATATVDPDKGFITERMLPDPAAKPIERPFILPPSTAILDDYFFSQRELLAWRYLGENCTLQPAGNYECKLGKAEFGALIPRQRASVLVSMQYMGREKVNLHGKDVELDRFELTGEGINWTLWLDSAHKLQRVLIADEGTEVVRD